MAKKAISKREQELLLENEELHTRLAEAEETLNAIRSGEVDAIVVSGADGEKIYSLTSAETPYRVIVEEMYEGAVVLSIEGIILFCNRRFAELVSAPQEQIVGSKFSRFVVENDKPKYDDLLLAGIKERSSGEIECLIHDNSPMHFRLAFSPLPPDTIGDVCIMTMDITELKQKEDELRHAHDTLEQKVTERTTTLAKTIEELATSRIAAMNMMQDAVEAKKELEIVNKELQNYQQHLEKMVEARTTELQAANKELEAFSYSVSHDLRAPLRAIEGYSRFLLEDYTEKLDEEGRRLLNVIRINTQQMDQLITDILGLSRVSRTEMRLSRIDMKTLVNSIYNETTAPEIQQKFVFSVEPLPEVFGDPTLIRQVWVNLISNAIKYTLPKEERRIEIGGRVENDMNIYYIKDTGVGFNPEYIHKLFGLFQRLHKDDEFEGTGVGLAIVQRIILRHGGKVWAEGKLNEGATFWFSIPIKEAQDEW